MILAAERGDREKARSIYDEWVPSRAVEFVSAQRAVAQCAVQMLADRSRASVEGVVRLMLDAYPFDDASPGAETAGQAV
jgi:hypothetical protein